MSSDVFSVACGCRSSAKTRSTAKKYRKHFEVFPVSRPLEFTAIDLLGPVLRTDRGQQFMLLITKQVPKLARREPLWTTTDTEVANACLQRWVYAYGALACVLNDIEGWLVAETFTLSASCLVSALSYHYRHLQTTRQTERVIMTIVQCFRSYVEKHQRD